MKKNGKYCNGKKRMSMKPLAVLLALTLLAGCAVGGTLAWLYDTTDDVENTFTVGNIDIKLEETGTTASTEGNITVNKKSFKMVPGANLAKDPVVTVEADSEKCWVFVEVNASDNLGTYIDYAICDGWTQVADKNNLYYQIVATSTADQPLPVLTCKDTGHTECDGCVNVKTTVTKTDMDALEVNGATQPTLSFKAYAIQYDHLTVTGETEAQKAASAFDQIR